MPPIYDKLAKYYDRAFAPFERRWLAKFRAETLAHLPNDGSILEIGAGTGANFGFYPKCRMPVASELSMKMIEVAKGKTNSINLVQADAECLPFPANHFDAAFATLVFCSIPHPDVAFAEAKRILVPGGRLIIFEHVRPDGVLGFIFDILNVLTVALIDDHFNRQTAKTAAEAGFKIVGVRTKFYGILNLIVCES